MEYVNVDLDFSDKMVYVKEDVDLANLFLRVFVGYVHIIQYLINKFKVVYVHQGII